MRSDLGDVGGASAAIMGIGNDAAAAAAAEVAINLRRVSIILTPALRSDAGSVEARKKRRGLQAEILLHDSELLKRKGQILAAMSSGDLGANTGFALRHHRVGETDHIHAPSQHRIGETGCESSVAQHDRHDGMSAKQDIEAEFGHAFAEVAGIVLEPVSKFS